MSDEPIRACERCYPPDWLIIKLGIKHYIWERVFFIHNSGMRMVGTEWIRNILFILSLGAEWMEWRSDHSGIWMQNKRTRAFHVLAILIPERAFILSNESFQIASVNRNCTSNGCFDIIFFSYLQIVLKHTLLYFNAKWYWRIEFCGVLGNSRLG